MTSLRDGEFDRGTLAVLAVTVLALAARFVLLGDRVAHWDEARVGFWVLHFDRTGEFVYRPIIHGPFYHHVNPVLFDLLGVTDFAMRVAPALVGGLLPLTALLFRHRLRSVEVAALAFFLAANPLLLYYSRFMRGDPLVAAFMFAAFAFLVRAIDGGSQRHVVAGFLLAGLGFTTKENALVYVVCWLGALGLLLFLRLYTARYRDTDWYYETVDLARWVRNGVVTRLPAIAAGAFVFLVVVVYFYAPRSPDPGAVAFNNLAADPTLFPAVVSEATVGTWQSFYGTWVGSGHQDHPYLPYLAHLLATLSHGALAVTVLAFVGFVGESVTAEEPRPVVLFAFFWGFASLLGYPIITDIQAPWAGLHVVVPFAVPAAVGLGAVVRLGRLALDTGDRVGVALALLVLVGISVPIGAGNAQYVYMDPSSAENPLVQYAQPADDMHPSLHAMERVAREHEGTDVLLYGNGAHPFVEGSSDITQYPSCAGHKGWFNALPLPWYMYRSHATVECVAGQDELGGVASDPPVVVAQLEREVRQDGTETVWVRPDELDQRFGDYATYRGKIRTTDMRIVIYVDESRVPDAALGDPAASIRERPAAAPASPRTPGGEFGASRDAFAAVA